MNWESEANDTAKEILRANAEALFEEAERVANRLDAGAVSATYVKEAAFSLRIRRPPGAWADLLVAIGIGMVGIAGGVLAVVLTAPASTHLKIGWVEPASIALACAGFLLFGIGGTLKVKNS